MGSLRRVPAACRRSRARPRRDRDPSIGTLTVLGPGNTVLATRAIPSSTSIVRFDEAIEIDAGRDGYAIIRVDGDRPMAPNVGDIGSFLVYPMAVTNPIWIDSDGDGKVTPIAPSARPESPQ